MYDQMVCLVGENPLPIYLGIKQFAAPNATLVLIHSKQTKPQADALAALVRFRADIQPKLLTDPFSPFEVDSAVQEVFAAYPKAVLNYTGGTKVMSGFGLSQWKLEDALERAFYLEEAQGLFHFGNQRVRELLKVDLTLDELKALHQSAEIVAGEPATLDTDELVNVFNQVRSLYTNPHERFFEGGEPNHSEIVTPKYKEELATFVDWLLRHKEHWRSETQAIAHDRVYKGTDAERMVKCAAGGWFEQLIEQIVYTMPAVPNNQSLVQRTSANGPWLVSESNVLANQRFLLDGPVSHYWGTILEFESDLLVVQKHRLRYISVTTSRSFKTCKAKMFEAKYRAQQIGGGLASSCVVCLGQDHYNRDLKMNYPFVEACKAALGNDPRHTFFGLQDVQNWITGKDKTLRDFLTN